MIDLLTAADLTISYGVDLLDSSDTFVADISGDVRKATVSHDINAKVPGRLNLTVARELDWTSDRLRPYQILSSGGRSERWNLGVYSPVEPARTTGEDPRPYVVQAYDKTDLLQHPVGDTYIVAQGINYVTAVEGLIAEAAYTGVPPALEPVAYATPETMYWVLSPKTPTTWLDVANDLLDACEYAPLYADREGVFRTSNRNTFSVAWDFDISDVRHTVVSQDRTLAKDEWNRTNWWKFIRADMLDIPIEGQGIYTVDESDGGTKYRHVHMPLVATSQEHLVAQGNAVIYEMTGRSEAITIKTSPLPNLFHRDVVTYNDPELGQERLCRVTSWNLPLGGPAMTLVLEPMPPTLISSTESEPV